MYKITNYVNAPSVSTVKELFLKYPAFVEARPTEEAKNNGVKAFYFTRNGRSGDKDKDAKIFATAVMPDSYGLLGYSVDVDKVGAPFKLADIDCDKNYSGIRPEIYLVYNPDLNVVKSVRYVEQKSLIKPIFSENMLKSVSEILETHRDGYYAEPYYKVSCTAPVFNYRGIDYIWLNQSECEDGREFAMRGISLKLLDAIYDYNTNYSNYRTSDYGCLGIRETRQRYEDVALNNRPDATDEEKAILIKVRLTDDDNYLRPKLLLTEEQKQLCVNYNNDVKDELSGCQKLFLKTWGDELYAEVSRLIQEYDVEDVEDMEKLMYNLQQWIEDSTYEVNNTSGLDTKQLKKEMNRYINQIKDWLKRTYKKQMGKLVDDTIHLGNN